MVGHAPTHEPEAPLFERPARRIVTELRHLPRHRHDRLLDHVLRVGILQAGAAGDVVKHPPIEIEERLPALAIIEIPEPAQEAPACFEIEFGDGAHAIACSILSKTFVFRARIFQMNGLTAWATAGQAIHTVPQFPNSNPVGS